MGSVLIILLGILFVSVIIPMQRRQEQEERTRKREEENHLRITDQDRLESDRLMETELFLELTKRVQESVTRDVLNEAKNGYPWFQINFDVASIEVAPGKAEDDFGVSYVRHTPLKDLGCKPIKNYDQIRVLFYSIGRLDGFQFRPTLDYSSQLGYYSHPAKLAVYLDKKYWEKLYRKEQIRIADEKNAGLKDFF